MILVDVLILLKIICVLFRDIDVLFIIVINNKVVFIRVLFCCWFVCIRIMLLRFVMIYFIFIDCYIVNNGLFYLLFLVNKLF